MFSDFPEQKGIAERLQRSLERDRLAHAYLFAGPSLEELEALARTLAKTLNCLEPPRRAANNIPLDSCDRCANCRRIDQFNHPDVTWLRPESKTRIITIDQTRELIQIINLKPSAAAYKIAVIVAADRLNQAAANAFLKTLEEPPGKAVLILLSTEPQRILETILSRCLRLTFAGERARLAPEQLAWLTQFSGAAADPSGGLMGRYKLLDHLLKKLAQERAEIETALTARSPLERYHDLDAKTREKLEDELAAGIEAEYRRRRADLVGALQWWFRDVWLKTLPGASGGPLSFPELPTASVAQRLNPASALANLDHLDRLQRQLHTNVQEALALEVALLQLKL